MSEVLRSWTVERKAKVDEVRCTGSLWWASVSVAASMNERHPTMMRHVEIEIPKELGVALAGHDVLESGTDMEITVTIRVEERRR